VYGARRWFDLGFTQMQPSELAKPVLVIYLAGWLCSQGTRVQHWLYGVVQFGVVLGLLIALVMLEPDMGTSMVLATVGIGMLIVGGARITHAAGLLTAGGVAFLVLALSAEYRRERVFAFLNPESNTSDTGWHLLQARLALGDGGLFGVGLGSSRQKFTWLPAPHNDAIFAVIGEELGLIGAALVILLFGLLGYRGLKIAGSAPDRFGMLIAVGASTWIMFQALFNIGGITSAIPFTGITLPFVSYGGTSMVVTLASMGMVLNVSRQAVYFRKRPDTRAAVESPTSDMLAGARLGQFAEPLVNTDSVHTIAEYRPPARVYRDWPEW
jgi:cell division protein FtsW